MQPFLALLDPGAHRLKPLSRAASRLLSAARAGVALIVAAVLAGPALAALPMLGHILPKNVLATGPQ